MIEPSSNGHRSTEVSAEVSATEVSAAETFRLAWLTEYSAFVGPPTTVLALWICWRASWPQGGIAAVTAYVAFNLVWSVLERDARPVTRGSHPRAWANGLIHLLVYQQLGDTPGAWILLVPTIFGAMGSPTPAQARYVISVALVGFTAGSVLCGVVWTTVLSELFGLVLIAAITERLYIPLVLGAVRAQVREQELEQANASLEHSLDARKIFLATVSHEIRTPMNGVLGMAELLEGTALDEEQRRMLGVVRTSGAGLLHVINDVLDMSKLEAGQMDVEAVPTDVVALAEDVVKLLQHGDLSPAVTLAVLAQDVPAFVALDPTRLRQVLLNLVGNACKFTMQGHVHVHLSWATSALRVEVEDTGIGISVEGQARLFQPFAQADASTSRHYGGTGLGLAISERLVDLMGGALKVRSHEGEGSTFSFTIQAPVAPSPTLALSPSLGEIPAARVLLVDDNRVNLMVARAMLERLGSTVVTAESGVRALELVAEDRGFELILLDCQMPGMDGFEVCRRLRAAGWTGPVIALTAGVTPEERDQCRRAKMDDVLAKPATLDSVAAVLLQWGPDRGVDE